MSTVVLTPTHIACDHTVCYQTYPYTTKVDMKFPKLFIPPSRSFVVGTVGEFLPEAIDNLEVYDILAEVFNDFINQQVAWGLVGQLAGLRDDIQKKMDSSVIFNAFDPKVSYIFLVSKKFRFILRRLAESKRFYAVRLDDYAGIGSGGSIAVGMLRGGRKIHDIWEDLHRLDLATSVEHTVIPLSSLRRERFSK